MDEDIFKARFQEWRLLPGEGDPLYHDGRMWEDVGSCALDARLTELAKLYLASDSEQRKFIRAYFSGKEERLWELIIYVRRIAKLITSAEDIKWLRLGLAAASIEAGRWDFRDLIVSLVILRFAAERVGLEPLPFFDEIIEISNPTMNDIFNNARNHSTGDIEATVKAFGPEDWAAKFNS